MPVSTKSNLPQNELLKWNLKKAAVELGTTVDTLKKSLNQVSAEPDADGLYTTGQLIRARYGELYQEKLRVHRETADRIALENQITRGETLNRAALEQALVLIADAIKGRIMSADIPREVKEDVLKDIASIQLVPREAARSQTRLQRLNNNRMRTSTSTR